jgi:hypothetical protein
VDNSVSHHPRAWRYFEHHNVLLTFVRNCAHTRELVIFILPIDCPGYLVPGIALSGYKTFPAFPITSHGFCGFAILTTVIGIIMVHTVGARDLIVGVWAIIWILYFLQSERVDASYRRSTAIP